MDTISYTLSTVPGNSEYLVVADSTYGINGLPASAASEPAPGNHRGQWARFRRVSITVKNGDQQVSIVFRAMTNPTLTTSSAFETDPDIATAGTYTLAASTTKTLDWKVPTPDWRIYVLAGANNPDSMITTVTAYDDAEPGA